MAIGLGAATIAAGGDVAIVAECQGRHHRVRAGMRQEMVQRIAIQMQRGIEQQRLFASVRAHECQHPIGRGGKPDRRVDRQQGIDPRMQPKIGTMPGIAVEQIDVRTPGLQLRQCCQLRGKIVLAIIADQADRQQRPFRLGPTQHRQGSRLAVYLDRPSIGREPLRNGIVKASTDLVPRHCLRPGATGATNRPSLAIVQAQRAIKGVVQRVGGFRIISDAQPDRVDCVQRRETGRNHRLAIERREHQRTGGQRLPIGQGDDIGGAEEQRQFGVGRKAVHHMDLGMRFLQKAGVGGGKVAHDLARDQQVDMVAVWSGGKPVKGPDQPVNALVGTDLTEAQDQRFDLFQSQQLTALMGVEGAAITAFIAAVGGNDAFVFVDRIVAAQFGNGCVTMHMDDVRGGRQTRVEMQRQILENGFVRQAVVHRP